MCGSERSEAGAGGLDYRYVGLHRVSEHLVSPGYFNFLHLVLKGRRNGELGEDEQNSVDSRDGGGQTALDLGII